MSTQPDASGATPAAADQPSFQIEKLYVKDLSLEVPNAPQVFMQSDAPQLEIQVANQAAQFSDGLFDVVVTVTVTARAGEKTDLPRRSGAGGHFSVRGIPRRTSSRCSRSPARRILYPYAREAISDLVTRAGFPAVVLQPVSFEQMYMERRSRPRTAAHRSGAMKRMARLLCFSFAGAAPRQRRISARCRTTPRCSTTRPRARRRPCSSSSATIRSR
jgi:preprotein translocase subunit SecB